MHECRYLERYQAPLVVRVLWASEPPDVGARNPSQAHALDEQYMRLTSEAPSVPFIFNVRRFVT